MKRRYVVFIALTLLMVSGVLIVWGVQLAIDWSRPNLGGWGWVDSNNSRAPLEGARLIAHKRDQYDGTQTRVYFPCQVLIVFDPESKAEVRGSNNSTTGTSSQPGWRFRFEDGVEKENSISITVNEAENSVLIEDRRFHFVSGNLFCVFINPDMEFAHVEQLNETITAKATIADFKRLREDNAAVQAIRTR